MHSPNTRDFESLRSALWLVVDLCDDWIDVAPRGSDLKVTLQDVRWALMDQLHEVRHLEQLELKRQDNRIVAVRKDPA